MPETSNSRLIKDGNRFFTLSNSALSVYGETVKKTKGGYLRQWDPRRSKFSAALHKKIRFMPFMRTSSVLYLGASSGTTVSHISDLCDQGKVYAVEISYDSFVKLLDLASQRDNIYPILEDANTVEKFSFFVGHVDIIYQDIAQRNQTQIFNTNAKFFKTARKAILILKAKAITSKKKEREILDQAIGEIEDFKVKEIIDLRPYDKANYLIYMER